GAARPYDHLDLDRDSHRQGAHANRRAGVLAGVPEPGDQEVGGAVDDNRLFDEVRSAVHHPEELDDPRHAIQVADLLLETAEAVENYELGRLAGGVDVDVLSTLAPVGVLPVVAPRPMASDKHRASGPD